MIRNKAKEVAKQLQIPEDKFKASSGWVENFKHRHGIRRGQFHGNGRNARLGRLHGVADSAPVHFGLSIADYLVQNDLYAVEDTMRRSPTPRPGNVSIDSGAGAGADTGGGSQGAAALIAACRPRCAWGPPLVHLAFRLPALTVPRLLRSLRSPLRPLITHRQSSPVGITVASRTTWRLRTRTTHFPFRGNGNNACTSLTAMRRVCLHRSHLQRRPSRRWRKSCISWTRSTKRKMHYQSFSAGRSFMFT